MNLDEKQLANLLTKDNVTASSELEVSPGEYLLVIVVHQETSGRIATLTQTVSVN